MLELSPPRPGGTTTGHPSCSQSARPSNTHSETTHSYKQCCQNDIFPSVLSSLCCLGKALHQYTTPLHLSCSNTPHTNTLPIHSFCSHFNQIQDCNSDFWRTARHPAGGKSSGDQPGRFACVSHTCNPLVTNQSMKQVGLRGITHIPC